MNEAFAEIVQLDDSNLLKVKDFSKKLWVEQQEDISGELNRLAEDGASFDFLLNEPELYSVTDCEYLYDTEKDSLILNPNYNHKNKALL